MMASRNGREHWRNEILPGVQSLPKIGVPGLMAVRGDNAAPILTGDKESDVLAAAAELGEGRMVVFAHDGYTSWLLQDAVPGSARKFFDNVLRWVTRGRYSRAWKVLPLDRRTLVEAFSGNTVLVWMTPQPQDVELVAELRSFVSQGGSVIVGVTPWGSMQLLRCQLEELSCYAFLRDVGIFLSDGYVDIPGDEVIVGNTVPEVPQFDTITALGPFASSCVGVMEPAEKACSEREHWRNDILSGVQSLPKIGVPGLMAVCGDNAEPILTGDTASDVLAAAAELGEGRMVVFTHDGYARLFLEGSVHGNAHKFCDNALRWVTRGRYTAGWKVLKLDRKSLAEAFNGNTVLVWTPDPEHVELVEWLKGFVNQGGSLIVGVTPWGCMQIFQCEVDELSCYTFLRDVGIFLGDGYSDIQGNEVTIARNKADVAHVGKMLHKCCSNQMKITEVGSAVAAVLSCIPDDDCEKLLRNHISAVDVRNLCRHPNERNPLKTNEERGAALFTNIVLKKSEGVAPGVKEFPGDFDSPPSVTCVDFQVKSHCYDVYPIGAYLPAGHTAIIKVQQSNAAGWKVQVGCHSDKLSSCDCLKRWPDIVTCKKLVADALGETKIYSSFGGSLYLISPEGNSSLSVCLKGVVPSPLFHFNDTLQKWKENRVKPGLWADLVGKYIMISVPSQAIRGSDNPKEAMQFWDEVVMAHHDLKGVGLDKCRRQWFVPDMQPSAGYMRSGYPIVTHMDAADPGRKMFMIRRPRDAGDQEHWGYFHELGHNMQDGQWTFDGTVEVTCNIFTLHAMQKLFGIPPWTHPWLEGQKNSMKSYLKNGANFNEWKNEAGVALGVYAQLARDFGFDTYKKVFREYENRKPNLEDEQKKIDHWVKTFSRIVGRNLVPAFSLWGIPVSLEVIAELQGLNEYRPHDEVTP